MPHPEPVESPNTWSTIIVDERRIQIHVFGEHGWTQKLLKALEILGIRTTEAFRSPCG
jgi:hypothetical protein